MEYEIYRSDELYHHGIKGQRWGIRRYQRKDGSLTPAGKRRIKKETEALKKEAEIVKRRKSTNAKFERLANKRKALEEEKKTLDGADKKKNDPDKAAKKSISEMSDDELRKAIDRARMEDTYKQLRPDPVPVEKHPLMKKMVNEALVPAAINSGKKALESVMDAAVKKALGNKVDPNSVEALTKVRDKLKLDKEIKELKDAAKGIQKPKEMSWEDKLKEQQYERNKIRNDREDEAYAEKLAEKQAKKDADAAKAKAERDAAAKAQERVKEAYDDYVREGNKQNSTYSQKGGERGYVNPNQERGLTVYNSSSSKVITSVTTKSNVSNGKSHISGLLESPAGKRNASDIINLVYDPDSNTYYYRWWDD